MCSGKAFTVGRWALYMDKEQYVLELFFPYDVKCRDVVVCEGVGCVNSLEGDFLKIQSNM